MKRHRTLACLAAAALLAGCARLGTPSSNGLVAVRSPHSAADTIARVEAQIRQRNLAVAARIDHAATATKVGKTLRQTEVLIFGNPQAGTPLMESAQVAGIDLPMKALVWTDAQSQVWLGYNDPAWIVQRHGGGECPAADNVRRALDAIAQATVAP